MIIVLKQHAPAEKVEAFCKELNGMGYEINDSVGSDTHILGLIGDTKALAESWVLANPVVETCRRVSEPYKKANRKFHPDDTIVDVGGDLDIHRPRQEAAQRHAGGYQRAGHNDRLAAGYAVQRTAHAVFRRDAPQRKLHVGYGVELCIHRPGAEAARVHRAVGLAQLLG